MAMPVPVLALGGGLVADIAKRNPIDKPDSVGGSTPITPADTEESRDVRQRAAGMSCHRREQ
jgi:hypothetical protein